MRDTSRQKGGVIRALLVLILALGLVAGAGLGGGYYYLKERIAAPGPAAAQTIVWLPPGSSVRQIARILKEEGLIASERIFIAAVKLARAGTRLRAGEYAAPAGASIEDLIALLTSGDVLLHDLTIPEGLTTAQILALVDADAVLIGARSEAPAEGALLPETYAFPRGETRDAMVRRMARAQSDALDELWPRRANDLPIASKTEAVILASIVEKETGVASERRRVAAVFVNRLRRGMRLESDPTVIYGVSGGAPLGRGLRQSELRGETPYNTYIIRGLPPTPIANPGRAAIEAVLNPAETDDLFFVADGEGGHAFAETLAEHNRNVARWRRIERARAAGGGR